MVLFDYHSDAELEFMKQYLRRLRQELIKKMNENHWTITQLSIICDISYHSMCNIVNGNMKDINFSTFVKICDNTQISYIDIFDISNQELFEKEICKYLLSDGHSKFRLKKV